MHNFRKLKIYQKAVDFAVEVYQLTQKFSKYEQFGLTNQAGRAGTPVLLNSTEGSGNTSNKEFKRFLDYSFRSNYEVITCIEIAQGLNYKKEDRGGLLTETHEIASIVVGFKKQP